MAVVLFIAGLLAAEGACGKQSDEGALAVSQLPPTQPTPQVIEPPNPFAHSPPLHNPGGVNGDRPARAVLGLTGATPATELRTLDIMPEETTQVRRGPPSQRLLTPASGLGPSTRSHLGPQRAGFH
jgi:hypothetical protein